MVESSTPPSFATISPARQKARYTTSEAHFSQQGRPLRLSKSLDIRSSPRQGGKDCFKPTLRTTDALKPFRRPLGECPYRLPRLSGLLALAFETGPPCSTSPSQDLASSLYSPFIRPLISLFPRHGGASAFLQRIPRSTAHRQWHRRSNALSSVTVPSARLVCSSRASALPLCSIEVEMKAQLHDEQGPPSSHPTERLTPKAHIHAVPLRIRSDRL